VRYIKVKMVYLEIFLCSELVEEYVFLACPDVNSGIDLLFGKGGWR
jgi:hypothetical protein